MKQNFTKVEDYITEIVQNAFMRLDKETKDMKRKEIMQQTNLCYVIALGSTIMAIM